MRLYRIGIASSTMRRAGLLGSIALLACAIQSSAVTPVAAESPADCSPKGQGVWSASSKFTASGAPSLGCLRTYTCGPKEASVFDSRCKLVTSQPQTVHGTCSWNGHGTPDTCSSCLTAAPSASDCKWHLEKK
jgi:hypothetical protein